MNLAERRIVIEDYLKLLKLDLMNDADKEFIYNIVKSLPRGTDIQKTRFYMYYRIGPNINEKNTQIKIAKYYECSKTAVRTSIYTIHKILFRIPEEQMLIMKNRVNQCLKK